MSENEKRINLNIEMPSLRVMSFIAKALQDDKFFEAAVENPLEVFKENGIRLNVESLTSKDLSTFFGALAGAKELIKKKQIKDLKFENVFGKSAEVRGSTLIGETDRGMWTQFTTDTLADRSSKIYSYTNTSFSGNPEIETRSERTVSHRNTSTGVSFHFDARRGIGSSTSSSIDTYSNTSFSGPAISVSTEDIINGPLINPVDLADIAAQINTYVDIVEHMEGE